MDGLDLLDGILLSVDLDLTNAPDRSQYIPYIWAKASVDIPNQWDDFSYEETTKVLDFSDALPHLELPSKLKNKEWHIVTITGNLLQTADHYIKQNSSSCKSFVKELHDYFMAMQEKDLITALASVNMSGLLLLEARNVLQAKGITFKDKEIREMKAKLVNKNKKRSWNLADILLILVVIIILFVIFIGN